MTEEKKRVHPDEAVKAAIDILRGMGYNLIGIRIGWAPEGIYGDQLPVVEYGYFGEPD